MMIEDADRGIRVQHWRQGRLLPVASHTVVAQQLNIEPLSDDDACIVISQSCDLLSPHFEDEPFAEIVIAKPLTSEPNPNRRYRRNPRWLHFQLRVCEERVFYEAWIWHRYRLPRQLFAELTPDTERQLADDDEQRLLVQWLAARYDRAALPDAFQKRLGAVKDKFEDRLRKMADVSAVFISLNSYEELSDEQPYHLKIILVMRVDDYANQQSKGKLTPHLVKLVELLEKCVPDIEMVGEPVLRSEQEITLHDLRMLRRWEEFDSVSYREAQKHQPPYPIKG